MKPIIFIPGIQATSLVNVNSFDYNYIWNAYDSFGSSLSTAVFGSYLEETLQLNPLYDQGMNTIVERGHLARFPYENAIVKLRNKLNKTRAYKNTPIYLFGYDWRMSNMESGRKLKEFVEYLTQKLADKNVEGFRFITHSMGGLVLSCYLKQLNDDYTMIDKMVITAPPFLGSPYALVHMVKGDGGVKSILNWVIGRNEDMRKVVRTFPGVFELLPMYPGALTYTDNGQELSLLEKKCWQSNIYDDISPIFDARLNLLQQFRDHGLMDLSKLPSVIRDKIVVIAGEDKAQDTPTHLQVERKRNDIRNFIDLTALKDGATSGDGTVPFQSATLYAAHVKTLGVMKENFFEQSSNSLDFHGLFLKDSRVQNIIERYMLCEESDPVIKGMQDWWETPNDSVRRL